jgi:polysaccharide chain length determinant protein (PEP-CTERM system associated)
MMPMLDNIFDQVRGAWRFRWIAMSVAWSVCILGWLAVLMMPDVYEASARVFVDTKTTLSEVTKGITVESNVDTQIQGVKQALLAGPQLEKVARESELDANAVTPQERQAVLNALRDRVNITGTLSRDSASAGLYIITYQNSNRDRAMKVVDTLLNTFVESAIGGKREGSATAQKFLTEQIKEYEHRLSNAENRLAEFKKKNFGLMPGNQGDYFTRMQGEIDNQSKLQAAHGIAVRRREELQRQLRGEQPYLAGSAASPGSPNSGNDTAARIRDAQSRLDELLLRFTGKHPDVVALRSTLEELQARQDAEIAAVRRGDIGAASRVGLNANPVFQTIQLQLNQTEVEIAALNAQIADSQRKVAGFRAMLDTAPTVEAELARLNRDYDVTRAQYQALVERLDKTRLQEEAESTGVVRFEVIDPPTAAFTPVAPNRPRLLFMVLVAGFGAGAGAAYLLHMMRPVFNNGRQLSEITALPVLGVVSMTWLDQYKSHAKRGVLAYACLAGVLFALGIVVFVLQSRASLFLQRLIA